MYEPSPTSANRSLELPIQDNSYNVELTSSRGNPAMQLSHCLSSNLRGLSRPQSDYYYYYQISSGLIFHTFNAFKHHPTF